MSHQQPDHAHGEVVHHELSAAPLVLGIGALIAYIGFANLDLNRISSFNLGTITSIVGIGTLLAGFFMWTLEDYRTWSTRTYPHKGRDIAFHGMVYFLATEVALFGSLFFAYFYQKKTFPFADVHFNIPLTAFNTALLVASGFTLHYGVMAIRKDNRKGLIVGLILSIILGAVFLALQLLEYSELIHEGFTLQSGAYGSIFYMLTGTHGFHVFVGLVLLSIVLVRALGGNYNAQKHSSVEAFAIYWHFVDVVWILLFFVVYMRVV